MLAHYGLDGALRVRGAELVGCCPLPEHAGDRNNRSAFRAHLERGLWHCMTHCGGGTTVDLVARLEAADWATTARVLATIEHRAPHGGTSAPRLRRQDPYVPYTRELRLQPDHPFLRQRGIRPDTAQRFEAGFWHLGGMLRGCVAVRLFDPEGRPLGYAGRRVDPNAAERYGKWNVPRNLRLGDLLFGWHRARQHAESGLILVEGTWDAMRVHQAGFPNVVALCGANLTRNQAELLAPVPIVLIMLDGDDKGRQAARNVAARIRHSIVRIISLPNGKDPADISDASIRRAIERTYDR